MIASIVPAAGRSERMGRPKLVLPIDGLTVIARVVLALRQGGAEPVVVIAPPRDAAGAGVLIEEAETAGADVVIAAVRPADMRASFELGLARLERSTWPAAVMLAPADSPGISPTLVAQLVALHEVEPDAILIPTYQGKRGHPIVLPWTLALQSRSLPESVGLNALVALHASQVVELEVAEPGALDDLDTPEDYQRWGRQENPAGRSPARHLKGSSPVQITVRLFALAKQKAGRSELTLELPESATVADLRRAIARSAPELAPLVPHLMIAVDSEYADDDRPLEVGAEVALIPPVSGGAPSAWIAVPRTLRIR